MATCMRLLAVVALVASAAGQDIINEQTVTSLTLVDYTNSIGQTDYRGRTYTAVAAGGNAYTVTVDSCEYLPDAENAAPAINMFDPSQRDTAEEVWDTANFVTFPHFVTVQMPGPTTVSTATIREAERAGLEVVSGFVIEGSPDGVSYVTVYTGTTIGNLAATFTFDEAHTFEFWRLGITSIDSANNNKFFGIGYWDLIYANTPPPVDCDESTADASTCTEVGQELYTLTTPASRGGATCTGSSTLCVAGDGNIPRDCVEITLHPNYCTAVGQELYTLTTSAANGGIACTGSSTLCVAGDGNIPRDCVETTADTSTCTSVGQDLYTLITPAKNGGAACNGNSTLCVAGDGSIPSPTPAPVCEPCAECATCEVCETSAPAPCPTGSLGRRRQLQPMDAAQSLIPFLAPLLAVVGIVARFQ